MRTEKVTIHTLQKKKASNDKITMLTCYDATFARLLDDAGVDVLLVGDHEVVAEPCQPKPNLPQNPNRKFPTHLFRWSVLRPA